MTESRFAIERPPMRVHVDAALIERLARLSRLALAPEEITHLSRDLGRILEYVAILEEADVEGLDPLSRVGRSDGARRADEPARSLGAQVATAEAPRKSDDGFAVPAFIDEG